MIKKVTPKGECGAVQIIEMTLVLPIVLIILAVLIYVGFYILQGASMYNHAQRIAIVASRYAAIPGYEKLYEDGGVTTKIDFVKYDGISPSKDIINSIMAAHELYRYWGNSFLHESEQRSLEKDLIRLVKSGSFLADSDVNCKIEPSNNVLSQEICVNLTKRIMLPRFFDYIGLNGDVSIQVSARAFVCDPAEFVRNVDIVFDFKDYVFDNMKIGKSNQTINERIGIFKQKFTDIAGKLGISF